MIVKIYGTNTCIKCKKAREKYPDAEYVDISNYTSTQMEALVDRLMVNKKVSYLELPLFEDEDSRIFNK